MLKKDVLLTDDNIHQTERLYHQSCLDAVKWENIPASARETISSILQRQYADWFGEMVLAEYIDAGTCWEQLAVMPERSAPCDMLQVIPTRLATELTGNSEMLKGISMARNLYNRLYDMQWPAGHGVRATRTDTGSLTLTFDSPWYPLSGELIGEISAMFEYQVQHSYAEPINGIRGQDCYDGGEHVGSNTHLSDDSQSPALYLVEEYQAENAVSIITVQQASLATFISPMTFRSLLPPDNPRWHFFIHSLQGTGQFFLSS